LAERYAHRTRRLRSLLEEIGVALRAGHGQGRLSRCHGESHRWRRNGCWACPKRAVRLRPKSGHCGIDIGERQPVGRGTLGWRPR
jgi:hypothetical protein